MLLVASGGGGISRPGTGLLTAVSLLSEPAMVETQPGGVWCCSAASLSGRWRAAALWGRLLAPGRVLLDR